MLAHVLRELVACGIVGISGGAQLTLLSPLGLLDLSTSLSRGLGHLDGVLRDRVKLATKIESRGRMLRVTSGCTGRTSGVDLPRMVWGKGV